MTSLPMLLVGHLLGDYVFQPRRMAEMKGQPGGFLLSLLHGAIYTVCVCLAIWNPSPIAAIMIFLTHWPIDRFNVTSWWCRKALDRHPEDAMLWGHGIRNVRIGFSCLHYAVVDNTFHLLLLMAIWKIGLIG